MMEAHERFVASGPPRIWTERFGDPELPAVLMVMGSAAQGVSCPDELVGRLVMTSPGLPEEVADLTRL